MKNNEDLNMLETYEYPLEKTKKIYTLIVSIIPIIAVYASGVSGFTLGDVLLAVLFIVKIIHSIRLNSLRISKRTSALLPLILIIPLISLIAYITLPNADAYNIIIRVVRRVFYYLCVVLVSDDWFNYDYSKKILVTFGKIGALYMFVQYIAYYLWHIVLHGYLPFLPVYIEDYMKQDYIAFYGIMFRPTSFLLEPAHISRYLIIPVIIMMFDDSINNRWLWIFAVSAAILASTSGTGIISLGIAWLSWIGNNVIQDGGKKKIQSHNLWIYLLIIISMMIALNTNAVQNALHRITNSNLNDLNTAGGARFGGYIQYLKLDTLHQIIGMGYGNTPNTAIATWFAGASYMLYGTGLVGFVVCVNMFIKLFMRNRNIIPRVICLVFAGLFFTDDSFMSQDAVLYFSLICLSEQTTKKTTEVQF